MHPKALIFFAACCFLPFAQAQNVAPPPPQQPAPAKPRRVITDVSTFHLEQMKTAPNQIGLASRGNDEPFVLCAPALGLSASTHPLFEWRSPGGPTATLAFQLLGENGHVLYTHDVIGYTLAYPADAPALQPGRTYTWQLADPATPSKPITAQVQIFDKPLPGAAVADPLDQAQFLLSHELWYDTIGALKTAIAQHPERKDLSQQLQALYGAIVPDCGNGR